MKILHICAGWETWNGAALVARMIAGEQRKNGCEIALRTWARKAELQSADEVWIHCGWMPCLWWAALWAKRAIWVPAGCYDPVRLRFHGWKKRLVGPIERRALRRCASIRGTCRAECDWIRSYLKLPADPQDRNGVRRPAVELEEVKRFFAFDCGTAEKKLAEMSLRQGKAPLKVLYLGRRHPLKGVEYLERAVAAVNGEAGAPRDPRLPSASSGPAVELRIVSGKPREQLEEDWRWADILCLPTLSDNFGLVIAEALERGVPVLTTDGAPAWYDTPGVRIVSGYRGAAPEARAGLLVQALKAYL